MQIIFVFAIIIWVKFCIWSFGIVSFKAELIVALTYSPLLGLKGNLWESKTPNSFSLNPVPHNHNCRKPYENGKGAAWAQSCFSLHLGNPHCTSSLLGPGSSGSQRSRTEKPFLQEPGRPFAVPCVVVIIQGSRSQAGVTASFPSVWVWDWAGLSVFGPHCWSVLCYCCLEICKIICKKEPCVLLLFVLISPEHFVASFRIIQNQDWESWRSKLSVGVANLLHRRKADDGGGGGREDHRVRGPTPCGGFQYCAGVWVGKWPKKENPWPFSVLPLCLVIPDRLFSRFLAHQPWSCVVTNTC